MWNRTSFEKYIEKYDISKTAQAQSKRALNITGESKNKVIKYIPDIIL
jgi:hypothetical protein